MYAAATWETPTDEGDARLAGLSMISEIVDGDRESAVIEARSELLLENSVNCVPVLKGLHVESEKLT